MLVSELRSLLNKYDKPVLIEVIVEVYKRLPKHEKDNEELSRYLREFSPNIKVSKAKKEDIIDFIKLKQEIEQFIDDAYNQYYLHPNKHIRKESRSKWRFTVKGFIKALSNETENYEAASDLLVKLFILLRKSDLGYDNSIFRTEDAFGAVGYKPVELFNLIVLRLYNRGLYYSNIRKMITMIVGDYSDYTDYSDELVDAFIHHLNSDEEKEMAVSECVKLYDEILSEKNNTNPILNEIVELILCLSFELGRYDDGIRFFEEKYVKRDRGDKLYVLLRNVSKYKLYDIWLEEYQKAVKSGIKPSVGLIKEFELRLKGL